MEESEGGTHVTLQVMKSLRLVNHHWSLWATGATTTLKIGGHHVIFMELAETLTEEFVNLNILHLFRIDTISDVWLACLVQVAMLDTP